MHWSRCALDGDAVLLQELLRRSPRLELLVDGTRKAKNARRALLPGEKDSSTKATSNGIEGDAAAPLAHRRQCRRCTKFKMEQRFSRVIQMSR